MTKWETQKKSLVFQAIKRRPEPEDTALCLFVRRHFRHPFKTTTLWVKHLPCLNNAVYFCNHKAALILSQVNDLPSFQNCRFR